MRENLMSGLGRGSRKRGEDYRACSLLHSQDIDRDARVRGEASARLASVFDVSMIDALLADAMASGTPIEGVDGLVNTMTKAVLERALEVEMTHEVGYERAGSGRSWFGEFPQGVLRPRRFDVERG